MERRLAAILAADMVGFSRQMGADEAGTLARIAALRTEILDPLLAEHRGRLFKTMGDGFLVEFTSAVQAVACALAIQSRLAAHDEHTRLRIGIHQGDVVVQDEDLMGDGVNIAARLEPLAEAGGIVISARVREDLAGKLAIGIDDLGPQSLKNIVAPVRAYHIRPPAARSLSTAMPGRLALPDKPSIAVLAFTNMSSDPEQEYFADGIAEDIITALSHIRWLFVVARNSSFTYKGHAIDIKRVGQELGVRYVLEGSVRRAGRQLRITVQLIEAEIGAHVWAERYDRTIDDMFAVQDEITASVISAIEPTLSAAEHQRTDRKSPDNLGSWELYHRGLWYFYRFTADDNQTALGILRDAVSLDPKCAAVHAALGLNQLVGGYLFNPQERAKWDALGLEQARIAAGLDPLDSMSHAIFGMGLVMAGQRDAAVKESARAVSLNHNNAMALAIHGNNLAYSGRPAEGVPYLAQAIRLSPLDPMRWVTIHYSATAHYLNGDYEACVIAAMEVCHMRPDVMVSYRALVAALAELGRLEEARRFADVIFVRFNSALHTFLSAPGPEWRPADHAAYSASLAKGGLVLRDGVLTRVQV